MTGYKVYERSIDHGQGRQVVIVWDDVCEEQYIEGFGHWYTGDGNPEFVGLSPREIGIKRNGFRMLRGEKRLSEIDVHHARSEYKREMQEQARYDAYIEQRVREHYASPEYGSDDDRIPADETY